MIAILVGVAAYGLTAAAWTATGVHLTWWGLGIFAVFCVERVVTVWELGWRHRLIAALMVPELLYAAILQASHLWAVITEALGTATIWHLNDKEAPHVHA